MSGITPGLTADQFVRRVRERPMLFDGAMGTLLIEAGVSLGECGVVWNVEKPDAIAGIHRQYLDAGCDIVTTNTFQASRVALEMHGLADRAAELNRAGAAVAREAAGDRALVAADIGPFGGFLEPLGDTTADELADVFDQQLRAHREGGADVALVETMSDPNEATRAVAAARAIGDWPVISTYAFQLAGDDFVTMMGAPAADVVRASIAAGADAVGANCGTGLDLDAYVRLAEALAAAAGDAPVILQPNAGSPIQQGGETVYPATPADMAERVPRLRDAGVAILGGCCGTSPAHLKAMREALDRKPA